MEKHKYRLNIISLMDRLFIETGYAKSRLQKFENRIKNTYLSSSVYGVPEEVQGYWKILWEELNTKKRAES